MVLSGVLVVVGCLLVPVAATAWWARATVSDSDRFVATLAPVADEPAVQRLVEDQLVTQVMAWVDEQELAERSVEALVAQGVPPRLAAALSLLAEPLRDRLQERVTQVARTVVESAEFSSAVEGSLRTVHEQLVEIITSDLDESELLAAAPDGTLRISLATLSNTVRGLLVEAGVPGAALLPEVTASIPIANVDQLVTLRRAYRALDAVATWLPVLALAALVGGVLLARRRLRWTSLAAGGVVGALLLGLLALAAARSEIVEAVPQAPEAAAAAADLVTESLRSLMRSLGLVALGVLVALALVTVARERPELVAGGRAAVRRATRSPAAPLVGGAIAAACAVALLVADLSVGAMLAVLALGIAAGALALVGPRAPAD